MTKSEKQLLQLYRNLDAEGQAALVKFARFLDQDKEKKPKIVETPKHVEPKENETVVGALKRLSGSYFMLDKSVMLNETSPLVAQHIMQGRAKEEVIEELEILFKVHYEKITRDNNSE